MKVAFEAVQTYYKLKKEYEAKRAKLATEYTGERLQREVSEMETSLREIKAEMHGIITQGYCGPAAAT